MARNWFNEWRAKLHRHETFSDVRSDSIKVWVKESRGSAENSGPYSLFQFELNCGARRIRTLSFARYNESGTLTTSHDGGSWQAIAPDTIGETLHDGACRAS